MRKFTGTAILVAAACLVAAIVLANVPDAGHSAPPVTNKTKPAHHLARPPAAATAPYYVAVNSNGDATVHATANGTKIATIRPPRGLTFEAVAGSENETTFVLAARSDRKSTRLNSSHRL